MDTRRGFPKLPSVLSLLATVAKRPLVTVLCLSLVLFLSGNWILPLLDRDEPRFAEASREMLQRHDFVIPRLNGAYRFDKPPLSYWCQIACFLVFGENPFAARLPSAVFATATALLLVVWGRRLGNEKAGFYAALMFITALQALIHARIAVADMPMTFFFSAAVWSGWEMTRPLGEHYRLWWCMLFTSLAFGFLAKGPVAWLPLAGLLLARGLRSSDFRFAPGPIAAGLALTLAIIGLWGIPALLATHGEFFTVGIGRHVLYRSFAIMEGHGGRGWLGLVLTLPLYFLTFFLSFFPWALRVPGALRGWWESRREDVVGYYLLIQAALVFALFTLVRTKLPHYTMPALPCISLWLALRTTSAKDTDARIARGLVAMIAVTLAVTLGLFSLARPHLLTTNLWRLVQPYARPDMRLAAVEFSEPSLIWQSRQILTNNVEFIPIMQAELFLKGEPPRLLVLPTQHLTGTLRDLATNTILLRATGFDTVQFKSWDVTAIIQP